PTDPTVISTLSLHDALPISRVAGGAALRARKTRPRAGRRARGGQARAARAPGGALARGRRRSPPARRLARAFLRHRCAARRRRGDRKSTRLNSSHLVISYAV